MKTPYRQQFRPEDFKDATSASSKVDYSFQQINRQLGALGARQILNLDFVYTPTLFPMPLSQLKLDKVVGFSVLAAADHGTLASPDSPPTLVPALVTWDRATEHGQPCCRLRSLYVAVGAGVLTNHRYTLTLEAVGG